MNLSPEDQAQYDAFKARQQEVRANPVNSTKSMLREKLDQRGKELGTNTIPYSSGSGVGATLQSIAAGLEGNVRRARIGLEQIFGDQSPENQYMLAQAAEQSNAEQQNPDRGVDLASFIGGSLPAMAAQALAMRAGAGLTSSAIGSTALDSFLQPAENMSDRLGNTAVGAGIAGVAAPLVGLASDAVSKAFGVGASALQKQSKDFFAPAKDLALSLVNDKSIGITPRMAFFTNIPGLNYMSRKSKATAVDEFGKAIQNNIASGKSTPLTFAGAGSLIRQANETVTNTIAEDFSKRYALVGDVFATLPPISAAPIKAKLNNILGEVKDPGVRRFVQDSDFVKLFNDMGEKMNYSDLAMLKSKLGAEIDARQVSRENLGQYKQLYKTVSDVIRDALENSGQTKSLGIVKYNGEEMPAIEFAKKLDSDYADEMVRKNSMRRVLGEDNADAKIFENFNEYAATPEIFKRLTTGFKDQDIGTLKATALDSLGRSKALERSNTAFDFEEFHKNWTGLPDEAKLFLTKKTGESDTEKLLPTYKNLNDITSLYTSLKNRGVFRIADGPEGDLFSSSIRKLFTIVSQSETLASQFVKATDKMVKNNNPKALLDLADKLNIKLPADIFFSQQVINAFKPTSTFDTKSSKEKSLQYFEMNSPYALGVR